MSLVYTYLVVYIAVLIIVSFVVSRKQTDEDFLISGRNRGGFQIFSSKFASAIGASYFITYTGFAYEYGLGIFAMLLGIIAGYLVFAYWAAPKIHENSKEKKFYTIGDFVYHKTRSRFAGKVSNVFSSVILFGWLLIGVIGGAKIINDFGFLSYEFAVILTCLVVLSYILLAGFKAVILTDIVQAFVIVVLLAVVTFGIVGTGNLGELFSVRTGEVSFQVVVGFFLFGFLAIFSYSNMYQLCYAARNKKKLKHGLGLAILPVVFASALLLLIGLFMAKHVGGLDAGLVFTEALKNFLPASLLPLSVVMFFAGIMSSADTSVYAISSHYAIPKKKALVANIRKSTVVLVVLVAIAALVFSDIVDVSLLTGGLSLLLSFPMVYLFLGGKNPNRFVGSAILGSVAMVLGFTFLGLEPIVAVIILGGSALGLLWKGKG